MKAIRMLSFILIFVVGFCMVAGDQADAKSFGKKTYGSWGKPPMLPDPEIMATGILEKLTEELNLTIEQEQEIAAIVAKYQVASKDKRETIWEARNELMQKILTEDLDETAIRAEYQKIAAESEKLREDRFVESAKMLSDIKAVLAEDQIKLLQEKSADWFQNKSKPGKHKKQYGGYKKKKWNFHKK